MKLWQTERPASVRAVATGAVCGFSIFATMFYSHVDSITVWSPSAVSFSVFVVIGPLILVAWSVIGGATGPAHTFPFARRIIQAHCCLAAWICLLGCSSLVTRTGPPFDLTAGFLGLTAALIDLVLLALSPAVTSSLGTLRIYRRGILALGGGSLIGASVWPFAILGLVVLEAELIADGQPYCIEVPSDFHGNYRTVTTLSELNGLKMHSPCCAGGSTSYQFAFHAVLMVATDRSDDGQGPTHWARRNWSYTQARFTPISERSASGLYLDKSLAACKPQPHFAVQLPIMPPR